MLLARHPTLSTVATSHFSNVIMSIYILSKQIIIEFTYISGVAYSISGPTA
jgi:hypothetical protein